jgi:hypothetical protein
MINHGVFPKILEQAPQFIVVAALAVCFPLIFFVSIQPRSL